MRRVVPWASVNSRGLFLAPVFLRPNLERVIGFLGSPQDWMPSGGNTGSWRVGLFSWHEMTGPGLVLGLDPLPEVGLSRIEVSAPDTARKRFVVLVMGLEKAPVRRQCDHRQRWDRTGRKGGRGSSSARDGRMAR